LKKKKTAADLKTLGEKGNYSYKGRSKQCWTISLSVKRLIVPGPKREKTLVSGGKRVGKGRRE